MTQTTGLEWYDKDKAMSLVEEFIPATKKVNTKRINTFF